MRVGVLAALVLSMFVVAPGSAGWRTAASDAAGTPPQTVVSLTFDDGSADQYQGLAPLKAHGMHATYYLNSPKISGDSEYMTWTQVADLAAAGNEIGGHTAYHADLPFIDPTEAQRQICYDRTNLLQRGYNATNFAFPYGDFSPTVKTLVRNCGYNSARTTDTFPTSNPSGAIPPPDPYQINVGTDTTTLTAMENAINAARNNGGGWVPITFHHICNGCNINYITASDFNTFLTWLQGQAANGVVVKTMQEVLGGATQPAVPGPGIPPAPNGTNALRNASMEQDTNSDGIPDCWTNDDFGNNSFVWTRTSDAHSGSWAERVNVTNYRDGDNKLLVLGDLGYCTPSVSEGHRYRITEWYKSDSPVYFTLFTRDSQWQVRFWQSSPIFPASSTWVQASFVTDAIPTGINGLQFGLTLGSNGSLTVDDSAFDDAAASGATDTTPPTVSVTAPTAGTTVSGFVSISATATDNVAVDHVDYLVDGSVAATLTSGPFTYNWNSRSVSNGAHSVSVRAVDLAGNKTTTAAITVFVSNQTANLLQNTSLEQGTTNPSCWLLAGYGTNTFTWNWTADAHSGTHAENVNITSYTNGDRKLLTAFSTGCSPAVIPGHTYTVSGWYKSTAKPVFMGFASTAGGNGAYSFLAQSPQLAVASDWTQASWSTPAIPANVTNLSVGMGLTGQSGSVTMDDFSMYDNAPAPDTTPPTSSLACNGGGEQGGCGSGFYNAPVEIDLSGSDDPGGSGLARIVYTLDGSTPSASNGTTYNGPFSVSQTKTVKFLAIDKAGNVEPNVHGQLIQIDTIAPTATIACNGGSCGAGFFNNTVSITMAAADQGGSDVDHIIYTIDGSSPSLTNGIAYIGAFSVNTNTTIKYVAEDKAGNLGSVNTQVVDVDAAAPVSSITCNAGDCRGWFNTPVSVALSATDTGGAGVAEIVYTTDGSDPSQVNGNVYFAPFTVAVTATVKYRAFDNAGNAEPVNSRLIQVDMSAPTVSMSAPSNGSGVSGGVTLTANAADDVGVDHVEFLVDGNGVAIATTSPYSVDWDSTSVGDGSHSIAARAVDAAGNSTTSSSVTVSVSNADTTPPVSAISCNGGACAGSFDASVAVTLSATDSGGSGLAQIVYTTDGSDPTTTNGTVYSGAFTVAQTSTVKYRAFDNAGNAEAVRSQIVQIDTTPPLSVINCNDEPCAAGWYTAPVSVTLTATGEIGGSGVESIVYTTDGSDPTVTNGTVYSSPFTVGQTTTVTYRAFDNAGNAEPVHSQLIQVDTSAPVSSVKCNGNACTSGFYAAAVSVTLAATDTGGSGVTRILYTTDGSDPTSTNALVYGGAFSLSGTATVKYRALDNAGNGEAVKSQLIRIDTTAPAVHLDAPSDGATVSGAVTLTATATDDVAVDHVDFLADGSRVATTSTSPYSITWDSTTVPAGSHTISARAVDTAGNSATSNSATVVVVNADATPPVSSIKCNGASCADWFTGAVSVTLTAADDAGGSGVATIVYTTNGSDPSLTNGTIYSGGFTVAATTAVKFRAYDSAGNAEAVNNQLIQIDTSPPTVSLSTPSEGATVTGSVTLSANAQDDVAVGHVDFLVDGNQIASVTSAPYDLTWDSRAVADGSHTIAARATDSAGNTSTSTAVTVSVSNPDTSAPVSTISCNATTCATGFYTAAVSVTLSASDTGGSGLARIVYTTDGSDPTATNGTAYTGAFTIGQTTTVKYRAFDNADNAETVQSKLVQVDTTPPLSAISCNGGACPSWFNTPVSVTLSSVDDTGGSGVNKIVYTTDGSTPTSTHGIVYAGAFTVSGSLTLKYRAFDNAGNAEVTNSQVIQIDGAAPSSTIKCNNGNCATSFYAAAVSVTLSATDTGGSGVSQIVYTTDGSDPTSTNGVVYSAAFTLASTATVKYRAFDRAGNAEALKSQLIRVDTTAPVSSISCNGVACGSGWFNASVSVTLSASDNSGGSGLNKIVYTTDGSTPTLTHGTAYAGAFTVSASPTTVKYRAFDSVGNAENTNSLTIQIDTVTPASMIRCNTTNCSASYYNAPVSVTLSASDVGGSGVTAIVYTTDNSTPTQSNGTVYTSAFTVAMTINVKYRSFDGAGNAEPVNSALIQVDTTPPSTTPNCSGSPCSANAWYPSGVPISLNATDDASGVSSIRYTTNGTVPTKTTGTVYSAPFTLTATTTINYRAFDNAGNSENNHVLTVQVDAIAPTVSVTSPAAGATVAGSTTLSANASDNVGVARVDFLVDGNIVGSAASAPYSFTWNSALVADGNHTVSARAADLAGNQATSTITVTVANANLLPNAGLESGSGNTPTCWFLGGYGTNTFTWSWTSDAHSGSHAENLIVSSYTNGDRKLLTGFNGTCSIATSAGRQYTITVWYKSDAKPALMAFTSTTGPTGAYNYLAQSPQQASASGWTQATWTTPVMPAGTTNLSVGMGLVGQAGTLTMDDFGAFQTG